MKPTRPTRAFQSPPPIRMTIRSGQPRNISAPIITNTPRRKRIIGEEPPRPLNSFAATAAMSEPSRMPTISGRKYCTTSAPCRPRAPAVSRRKQAMQKPMLPGLPCAPKTSAAMPITSPVTRISQLFLNQLLFTIFPSLFQKLCFNGFIIRRLSGKCQTVNRISPAALSEKQIEWTISAASGGQAESQ